MSTVIDSTSADLLHIELLRQQALSASLRELLRELSPFLRSHTRGAFSLTVQSGAISMSLTVPLNTAYRLSHNFEQRLKFQADIQDYVDMSISSTINLPPWGSKDNNEDRVTEFAGLLSKYSRRLRGFTAYPDGSRGGQPITEVPYEEAMQHKGVIFEENDICDISGKGGSCGV